MTRVKGKKRFKRNLKHFEKSLNWAIELFALHSYQFTMAEGVDDDNRAYCKWHGIQSMPYESPRQFTIYWNRRWLSAKHTGKKDVRKTAVHEVLEAHLSGLRDYANNTEQVITPRMVDDEIHRFIRMFENRILPKL